MNVDCSSASLFFNTRECDRNSERSEREPSHLPFYTGVQFSRDFFPRSTIEEK